MCILYNILVELKEVKLLDKDDFEEYKDGEGLVAEQEIPEFYIGKGYYINRAEKKRSEATRDRIAKVI